MKTNHNVDLLFKGTNSWPCKMLTEIWRCTNRIEPSRIKSSGCSVKCCQEGAQSTELLPASRPLWSWETWKKKKKPGREGIWLRRIWLLSVQTVGQAHRNVIKSLCLGVPSLLCQMQRPERWEWRNWKAVFQICYISYLAVLAAIKYSNYCVSPGLKPHITPCTLPGHRESLSNCKGWGQDDNVAVLCALANHTLKTENRCQARKES